MGPLERSEAEEVGTSDSSKALEDPDSALYKLQEIRRVVGVKRKVVSKSTYSGSESASSFSDSRSQRGSSIGSEIEMQSLRSSDLKQRTETESNNVRSSKLIRMDSQDFDRA